MAMPSRYTPENSDHVASRRLKAAPVPPFSHQFVIRDDIGALVVLDASRYCQEATLHVGNCVYDLYCSEPKERVFVLDWFGTPLAHSTMNGTRWPSILVDHGDRRFRLKAPRPFRRELDVYELDHQIGVIRPARWLSRRFNLELPDDVAFSVRLFMFWLVLLNGELKTTDIR